MQLVECAVIISSVKPCKLPWSQLACLYGFAYTWEQSIWSSPSWPPVAEKQPGTRTLLRLALEQLTSLPRRRNHTLSCCPLNSSIKSFLIIQVYFELSLLSPGSSIYLLIKTTNSVYCYTDCTRLSHLPNPLCTSQQLGLRGRRETGYLGHPRVEKALLKMPRLLDVGTYFSYFKRATQISERVCQVTFTSLNSMIFPS